MEGLVGDLGGVPGSPLGQTDVRAGFFLVAVIVVVSAALAAAPCGPCRCRRRRRAAGGVDGAGSASKGAWLVPRGEEAGFHRHGDALTNRTSGRVVGSSCVCLRCCGCGWGCGGGVGCASAVQLVQGWWRARWAAWMVRLRLADPPTAMTARAPLAAASSPVKALVKARRKAAGVAVEGKHESPLPGDDDPGYVRGGEGHDGGVGRESPRRARLMGQHRNSPRTRRGLFDAQSINLLDPPSPFAIHGSMGDYVDGAAGAAQSPHQVVPAYRTTFSSPDVSRSTLQDTSLPMPGSLALESTVSRTVVTHDPVTLDPAPTTEEELAALPPSAVVGPDSSTWSLREAHVQLAQPTALRQEARRSSKQSSLPKLVEESEDRDDLAAAALRGAQKEASLLSAVTESLVGAMNVWATTREKVAKALDAYVAKRDREYQAFIQKNKRVDKPPPPPPPAPTKEKSAASGLAGAATKSLRDIGKPGTLQRTAAASSSAVVKITTIDPTAAARQATELVAQASKFTAPTKGMLIKNTKLRPKLQSRITAEPQCADALLDEDRGFVGVLKEQLAAGRDTFLFSLSESVTMLMKELDDPHSFGSASAAGKYACVAKVLIELMIHPDFEAAGLDMEGLLFGFMSGACPAGTSLLIPASPKGKEISKTDVVAASKMITLFATLHVFVERWGPSYGDDLLPSIRARYGASAAWTWLAHFLGTTAAQSGAMTAVVLPPFLWVTGPMMSSRYRWQFLKLLRLVRTEPTILHPASALLQEQITKKEAMMVLVSAIQMVGGVDPDALWYGAVPELKMLDAGGFPPVFDLTEALEHVHGSLRPAEAQTCATEVAHAAGATSVERRSAATLGNLFVQYLETKRTGGPHRFYAGIVGVCSWLLGQLPPASELEDKRATVIDAYLGAAGALVGVCESELAGADDLYKLVCGALCGPAARSTPYCVPQLDGMSVADAEDHAAESAFVAPMLLGSICLVVQRNSKLTDHPVGAKLAWRWLASYLRMRANTEGFDLQEKCARAFVAPVDAMMTKQYGRQYQKLLHTYSQLVLSRELGLVESSVRCWSNSVKDFGSAVAGGGGVGGGGGGAARPSGFGVPSF